MAWMRTGAIVAVALGIAGGTLSGGSIADPQTPAALRGLPPPFLGVAVIGDGHLTAAIDSYGDIVDIRGPGPAGRGLIRNPSARQMAGTVPADTGIVPRVSVGPSLPLPLWRAAWVRQAYIPGTNVLRTVARIGTARVLITNAARGETLAQTFTVRPLAGKSAVPIDSINVLPGDGLRCSQARRRMGISLICALGDRTSSVRGRVIARHAATGHPAAGTAAPTAGHVEWEAARADRGWMARARPLGAGAPKWARRMYERSLLALRGLTDRRTGAVAAGVRDGWAYVWPRDAAAVAMAFARAEYRHEAHRVVHFLSRLDLDSAARFSGAEAAITGRGAEGDANGWVAAAARTVGLPASGISAWRGRADYREGDSGDYLGNAIASGGEVATGVGGARGSADSSGAWIAELFGTTRGLVRRTGDPGSGLDAAAAWAVRPFPHRALFPAVEETLRHLTARAGRFGITPGEGWPGEDPWTAPTAWTAWSLATLARQKTGDSVGGDRVPSRLSSSRQMRDRRAALKLVGALRRAATPAGLLPERVDARTGVPRSTTPLAWSHAFTILALQELWPGPKGGFRRDARPSPKLRGRSMRP